MLGVNVNVRTFESALQLCEVVLAKVCAVLLVSSVGTGLDAGESFQRGPRRIVPG